MVLRSDGPDVIQAMSIVVNGDKAYIEWLGPFVNMLKSCICTINLPDRQPLATESITRHGSPFWAHCRTHSTTIWACIYVCAG